MYYVNGRGDPGIFSSITRAIGGIARAAGSIIPGPLGAAAQAAGRVLAPQARPGASLAPLNMSAMQGPGGVIPTPGFQGAVQRFLPGGASGYTTAACVTKDGRPRRMRRDGKCWKRPAMNPGNMKAAGRAVRRITAARKMLRRLEASMPKVAARSGGKKRCGCK